MRRFLAVVLLLACGGAAAQQLSRESMDALVTTHDYVQKRASSFDRTGGNGDAIAIGPEETATLLDAEGPGEVTHLWFTIASEENFPLKKIVLRAYWDGEATPSVEAPIGNFFGLGLGEYFTYESAPLAVAPDKALNAFFPMPFAHHARITVTNEGTLPVNNFYFNIDYRQYAHPLAAGTLYFHAQYRQKAPNEGWLKTALPNDDPRVLARKNLDGKDNYVWLEASGRGHYVGVTMSVLQNQDGWWGEGDDVFFVDGAQTPSIQGTGSEDYFLGAWDFGTTSFSYASFGAPQKGAEEAGSRSSVYRFHLDSPIPFARSLRATIEHGHANSRSDNFYSVAYWYQTEPHAAFPPLPPVAERIPVLHPVRTR